MVSIRMKDRTRIPRLDLFGKPIPRPSTCIRSCRCMAGPCVSCAICSGMISRSVRASTITSGACWPSSAAPASRAPSQSRGRHPGAASCAPGGAPRSTHRRSRGAPRPALTASLPRRPRLRIRHPRRPRRRRSPQPLLRLASPELHTRIALAARIVPPRRVEPLEARHEVALRARRERFLPDARDRRVPRRLLFGTHLRRVEPLQSLEIVEALDPLPRPAALPRELVGGVCDASRTLRPGARASAHPARASTGSRSPRRAPS